MEKYQGMVKGSTNEMLRLVDELKLKTINNNIDIYKERTL